MNDNRLKTEKQSLLQRIRIRMVKLLDVLLVTGAFAFTWHFYYQGAMTFPFFEKGNWVVVGLFLLQSQILWDKGLRI